MNLRTIVTIVTSRLTDLTDSIGTIAMLLPVRLMEECYADESRDRDVIGHVVQTDSGRLVLLNVPCSETFRRAIDYNEDVDNSTAMGGPTGYCAEA